jgi:phosphate:Na+ symporter
MSDLLQILGGLGFFLYGISAMTSGLKKLAGERLRQWLGRSTRTTLSGVVSGATVTAIIQSSSATTVAAIGFVGAGLLTFTQALGVIFGANIGTTLTGWMVALLGFKLKLSTVALPLMLVAAFLYLFKSRIKLRGSGKALAGFCLIFVGIGYLQEGLAAYRESIDLSQFTADSLGGRSILVLIGIVLTLITQSSSATVATALTALNTGVLSLPQAAAVIIGADIGTTATALLATIGGSTASRRTGAAHVIYNVLTGIGAFFFLPVYLFAVDRWITPAFDFSPEVTAVSFHSIFNTLGVLIILPFTRPFARLIERLIPERTDRLLASFDTSLLESPNAATDALESGSRILAADVLKRAAKRIRHPELRPEKSIPDPVEKAIQQAREFSLKIGGRQQEGKGEVDRIYACVHLADHIERLAERMLHPTIVRNERLTSAATKLATAMESLANDLENGSDLEPHVKSLQEIVDSFENDHSDIRSDLIRSAIDGSRNATEMDSALDSHRWLRRLSYHTWRIAFHAAAAHKTSRSDEARQV